MPDSILIEDVARAKVNLDLLVIGKRDDGYHELDSFVVFTELCDQIAVAPDDELVLELSGPFASTIDVEADSNLVIRAARLLQAFTRTDHGARIRLEKNLPVAAGLGGGSADAAATLRSLNKLWGLGRGDFMLRELSLELGADLPVCMFSKPSRMRGLGERVDPIRLMPELWLVLINPQKPLPTPPIFKALGLEPGGKALKSRPLGFPNHPSAAQIGAWLQHTSNDLEEAACDAMPEIAQILEHLNAIDDCVIARMSGSGPTCFGLFLERQASLDAAEQLRAALPDYWVEATVA